MDYINEVTWVRHFILADWDALGLEEGNVLARQNSKGLKLRRKTVGIAVFRQGQAPHAFHLPQNGPNGDYSLSFSSVGAPSASQAFSSLVGSR